MEKSFPENMIPLGKKTFTFSCHAGLACFTKCCRNVDMFLFPYDVIRLKNALKIDSETFLKKHTLLVRGNNPYFPSLMMKLSDDDAKSCPFLTEEGCSVYRDRPSSCRTYPLERAVDRDPEGKGPNDYYFLTDHPYCLGHNGEKVFSVPEWIRNQQIDIFNVMNDLWTEIESVFLTNPWKGEGSGGPKQQLAFMVCYNIDAFRNFVAANGLLDKFRLDKDQKKRMQTDDAELLKFGFQWLKLVLTGKSNLVAR
jgi:uncharacterized protein